MIKEEMGCLFFDCVGSGLVMVAAARSVYGGGLNFYDGGDGCLFLVVDLRAEFL